MRRLLDLARERLARRQAGISLVETVVAVALVGAVVAVVTPVMTSSQQAAKAVTEESRAIDALRMTTTRLDRELRAACYIEAPAVGESGSALTFWTRSPSAGLQQVTYEAENGTLTREAGGTTSEVTTGLIVSGSEFSHTENSTGTRAKIDVHFEARFRDAGSPRVVETTIAGRNTWTSCT